MKIVLPAILGVVCLALLLFLMKARDEAKMQHDADTASINDFSNQLNSAQFDLLARSQNIITLSNRLDQAQTAFLTFSNQFAASQITMQTQTGQITELNQQLAALNGVTAENQTLRQQVASLTNQTALLDRQLSSAQTNLLQAGNDYLLLQNRLKRDIGERLVAERRFNNRKELQAQLEYLKENPAAAISTESILAGLDIEVKGDGSYHMLAQD